MELNVTLRDKEKIEKYKILFGMVSWIFYESMEIAIMDYLVHLHFKQFYFETNQV